MSVNWKRALRHFDIKRLCLINWDLSGINSHFAKKYMPLLGVTTEMNYNPVLDCLVIGSDEVFNCIQKNSNVGYSPELFGKDNHAKRLMTYAASFGNTTLEKLERYGKKTRLAVCCRL